MRIEGPGKDEGGADPVLHIDDLLPGEQSVNDPDAAPTGGLAVLGLTSAFAMSRRGKTTRA